MREWKRVLCSRRLWGILAFLLALNLGMIWVGDRRSSDDLRVYRQELVTFQDLEPDLALESLDHRMEALNQKLGLYHYTHDPEGFFFLREACIANFGDNFEEYAPNDTESTSIARELGALSAVREQMQYLIDYPAYLDTVHENAAQMAALAVFSRESSFSRRNIEKTDRDFPRSVSLSLDNDLALNAFASDRLCGYSLLVFLLAAVLEFFEERKRGLWSLIHAADGGRCRLALNRATILLVLSIGATAVLFGGKLLGLSLHYGGLGDLSRSIQSLAVFRDVPWVMNARAYLLLRFLLQSAGVYLVSLILWAVLQAVNHLPLAIAVGSGFLALEYCAFTFIPDSYALVILRYINIFAVVDTPTVTLHYLNLDLFGWPVQGFLLSMGLILPLTVLTVIINLVLSERKKPISRQNPLLSIIQRLRVPFSRFVGRLKLCGFELYKLLWIQKGAAVLLLLGAFSFCIMETPPVDSTLFDPQLAGVSASMQNPITEETLSQLDAKIDEYETWDESEALSYQLEILYRLRDKVCASLAAEDGLWLINQAGASALIGANNVGAYPRKLALVLLLTVCLLLPGSFCAEKQNKMTFLLCSVLLGRSVLWRKKLSSAYLTLALTFLVFEAGELYRYFSAYGALPLRAPLQSVEYFADFALPLSVGSGLVVFLLLRFTAFLLAATVVLLISQLCQSANRAMLLSAAVLVLPACLAYIGIEPANVLSLARLFSPMEVPLWHYAFAAVWISILLIIQYILWFGHRGGNDK